MPRWTDAHKVVPAVYVILRKGDEVLLLRRANTGFRDGWYSFPAGHIDGGEPAHVAAVREAAEEVGATVKPAVMQFTNVLHRVAEEGGYERIDFGFTAVK